MYSFLILQGVNTGSQESTCLVLCYMPLLHLTCCQINITLLWTWRLGNQSYNLLHVFRDFFPKLSFKCLDLVLIFFLDLVLILTECCCLCGYRRISTTKWSRNIVNMSPNWAQHWDFLLLLDSCLYTKAFGILQICFRVR